MSEETSKTGLTRAMKIAIGVVGVLVVAGVITTVALNGTGSPGARATPSPSVSLGPGPLPGAKPTTGSEVPTPTAAPPGSAPLAQQPPAQPATPSISAPLPSSAARDGGVVDGFPVNVAGPVEGSTVTSTSIAVQDTVMQLSLAAVSTASPDEIRAHYAGLWNAAGLREQPSTDGTTTFADAYGSLTLSFGSSGTGTLYTVYGVLRTQ